MPSQEILREEWLKFFEDFNRQHQGGNITLEEFDSHSGAHVVTWGLAFEGITVDLRYNDSDTVTLVVSENAKRRVTYVIVAPSDVKVGQTEDGIPNSLQIQAANGVTTSVHFPTSELPDDIMPSLLANRRSNNYQAGGVQQ